MKKFTTLFLILIFAHNAPVFGYIPDMNSRPYDFACVNGGWGDVADAVAILRLADKGLINLVAWGIKAAKEDDKFRYRESEEFLELARKDGLKNVPSKTLSGVSKSHVLYSSRTTRRDPLSLPAANSEMGKKLADLA